jgi:hypothetical protein
MLEDGDQDDCGSDDAGGNQGNAGEQLRPSGTVSLPERFKPIQASVDQNEANDPGKQIAESIRRFARYGKVTTAAIALAAVIQAVTSYFQWDAMRESNQVAGEAAKAAQESNVIAGETAARQLRAYVDLDTSTDIWIEYVPQDAKYVLNWKWRNFGQTPANNISVETAIDYIDSSRLVAFDARNRMVTEGKKLLAPGQEFSQLTVYQLTEAQKSLPQADHTIWVFTKIGYSDAFMGKHFTHVVLQQGLPTGENRFSLITKESNGD